MCNSSQPKYKRILLKLSGEALSGNGGILDFDFIASVAEVLKKNHASIVKKSMQESLELTRILDLRDFPGDENEALLTKDFKDILNDFKEHRRS